MRPFLKKTICLLLAGAFALGLAGCDLHMEMPVEVSEAAEASPTPAPAEGQSIGQTLADTYKADHIFSLNCVDGESFNPYTTNSHWNKVVSMLMYETLVNADSSFEAQPNLVTSWQTDDGMHWTFYVDTSRKFHSGGHMTGSDAVATIDQARYTDRYGKRFANVVSTGYLDEESFTVTLSQPNWRFYELLTIPCVESGSGYSSLPAGTGPYKLNSRGNALDLDPNYPGAGAMSLKTIHLKKYVASEDILQAFEDSYLDLVTNNPMDMSSLGYSTSNIIKYVDTTNLHYIGYNAMSPIFGQGIYRSIVTYAIDRATIVSGAMQGSAEVAELPIHPSSALYPKSIARNLGYSRDSLDIALQNLGATDVDYDGVIELGGIPANVIFLVCSDSPAKLAAARQIAGVLRDIGFNVTMRELNAADYDAALKDGGYDLYYAEVKICNDWDLSQLVTPGGSLNFGGISDPNLTGYIQAFLGSNGDMLAVNTENLYQYIAQTAPITAVCFEKTQVLYHRGVLSTISPNQDNFFVDIRDWKVDLD